MTKFLAITIFVGLFLGCKKKECDSVSVPIDTYLLNPNCFSTTKLQQAEVVITNEDDYKLFEDSIRVYWFASCDTIYLPEIDFDSSFFVGMYTQAPGCSLNYEYQVQFCSENSLYEYLVIATSIGTCEILNSAFNCAIVPRLSSQINVDMNVEYKY